MARLVASVATADPTLVAKSRSTWEVLSRVSAFLKPYRWMAVATVGCAVLSLACAFAYPKFIPFIVDEVIAKKQVDRLPAVLAILIAVFLLREVFNGIRIRINNQFEQNVIYDMRRAVFSKLQRLPVSYFDHRASGDLMTRVIEDVNSVERVLIDGTEQGSVALLSLFAAAFFMMASHPGLALFALIPVPILVAGALWYTVTAHRRYRAQRLAASAMNALLMDDLQGIRQIKAYGRQAHEDSRFASRADDLREGTMMVMRAWAYYSPAMAFATALGTAFVLWAGGRLVMDGHLTVGKLFEFLFYLVLFYEPIGRLHGLNQMMQAARAAGERVFDILDAPAERTDRDQTLPDRVRGEVVYRDVTFGYEQDRPILKNISLRARPGEMVALVGPTGAGKSTLVNLLPGFYEATAGGVTIDGQDISHISLESLRRHVSFVSQEAFLFNGTVGENIMYGRLDASQDELHAAAQAANCHEFITRLPHGYDTRVGERGVKLSVGEKQRVSIARAILKDARILILDEATASVDTATEKLIQQALERLLLGRTSFVIAHRLSTIQRATQILVLRHGEIIERGSHGELLAAGGLYARLCQIQNTTFIEEGFERLGLESDPSTVRTAAANASTRTDRAKSEGASRV